ncbi:MAG: RecX family transcriptional regulator [Oscillospiraceae bacterium]|nr:RecX family transcriptional regulator [Oscillospiraceae bacterium]
MKITEIKMTKKGRYALFCGEEFLFSVDESTFADFGLHRDMELSDADLEQLRKSSEYRKALSKGFTLLGVRDHSEYELYTKLLKNFDEHTSAQAVTRIRELGYLDDGAFARRYTEELLRKGKSAGEIRRRLSEKRISRETAEEILSDLETDERPLIAELIEGKYAAKLREPNGRQKVYAALLRRGFRSSDVSAALREFEVEDIEYTEE